MIFIDWPGHGVEEVAKGLKAEGISVLDKFALWTVIIEVADDLVWLFLDDFIYFLQCRDF